jgi:hypothetical protein
VVGTWDYDCPAESEPGYEACNVELSNLQINIPFIKCLLEAETDAQIQVLGAYFVIYVMICVVFGGAIYVV